MKTIAHIVNPVRVTESSDLFKAQPITFASMELAKQFATTTIQVEQYSAQYPEDREYVPYHLQKTFDLSRSVRNFVSEGTPKKLPLLKDILDRLYESSSAEYFVYTNVDIALMPHFYTAVNDWLQQGYDCLIINRRSIPSRYSEPEDLPLLFMEIGQTHPGWDCFVFPRELYPSFELGNVCLGMIGIGRTLLANLVFHSHRHIELRESHLTFHVGDDRSWLSDAQNPLRRFNIGETKAIVECFWRQCSEPSKKKQLYWHLERIEAWEKLCQSPDLARQAMRQFPSFPQTTINN